MLDALDFTNKSPAKQRSQRGSLADAALSHLGITTAEQAAVYKAIKAGGIKHESSLMRATGLAEVPACRALHDLVHLNLVRQTDTAFGPGNYEIIERR